MREIFKRTEGEEEVSIEVFLDAKEHSEFKPWILSVFIRYDSFNDENDGLDSFFETKESLIIDMELDEKTVYVGNRLVGEWSELYFYSEDSKGLEAQVANTLKPTKYVYQANVVKDAEWEFFQYNIFPTDLELCLMQSQKIVEHLEDEGDNISVAREVEHYASFETPTQKDRFVKNASEEGFEYKDDISGEDIEHGVALVKTHNVTMDELEKVITPLIKLIQAENGEYELWSTTLQE